jgi:hypothetical protein
MPFLKVGYAVLECKLCPDCVSNVDDGIGPGVSITPFSEIKILNSGGMMTSNPAAKDSMQCHHHHRASENGSTACALSVT